ncbi:mitochondrial import inner membrane translocase subunit Tim29 [Diachasmimorpha longicaudata]|uniref:mitochondrial import inner membrane translocase subunit Tim29 n=1 Tax=Diachasmimorpha longicaudata TaxID=58733 RepID=UPI0030B89E78
MSVLRTSLAGRNKLRSFGTAVVDSVKNVEKSEKAKTTIIERWKLYWKNLYLDYKDVGVDVVKECRNRPVKAGAYFSVLAGCYYLSKTNPDLCTFREELLKNSMRLMYVGESTRNPTSMSHVLHMKECLNNNIIRRLNLGVMSFIWLDNYSDRCALYKVQCNYLKPEYTSFHERIVDVGFLGKWWILEDKMKNYDINEIEFS